ncbi:unnamed protein product [Amoebophrya sp. A25]|nr:unnamed protein product [Amoebophrya sp. A25]|eukprot:GSA25T00023627001.1
MPARTVLRPIPLARDHPAGWKAMYRENKAKGNEVKAAIEQVEAQRLDFLLKRELSLRDTSPIPSSTPRGSKVMLLPPLEHPPEAVVEKEAEVEEPRNNKPLREYSNYRSTVDEKDIVVNKTERDDYVDKTSSSSAARHEAGVAAGTDIFQRAMEGIPDGCGRGAFGKCKTFITQPRSRAASSCASSCSSSAAGSKAVSPIEAVGSEQLKSTVSSKHSSRAFTKGASSYTSSSSCTSIASSPGEKSVAAGTILQQCLDRNSRGMQNRANDSRSVSCPSVVVPRGMGRSILDGERRPGTLVARRGSLPLVDGCLPENNTNRLGCSTAIRGGTKTRLRCQQEVDQQSASNSLGNWRKTPPANETWSATPRKRSNLGCEDARTKVVQVGYNGQQSQWSVLVALPPLQKSKDNSQHKAGRKFPEGKQQSRRPVSHRGYSARAQKPGVNGLPLLPTILSQSPGPSLRGKGDEMIATKAYVLTEPSNGSAENNDVDSYSSSFLTNKTSSCTTNGIFPCEQDQEEEEESAASPSTAAGEGYSTDFPSSSSDEESWQAAMVDEAIEAHPSLLSTGMDAILAHRGRASFNEAVAKFFLQGDQAEEVHGEILV